MRASPTTFRQTNWRIFRWPLVMAFANAIGLVAALIGDGWYDFLSWVTLGATLVVTVVAWFDGRSR